MQHAISDPVHTEMEFEESHKPVASKAAKPTVGDVGLQASSKDRN
jgi:hypothetical protein